MAAGEAGLVTAEAAVGATVEEVGAAATGKALAACSYYEAD